MSANHISNMLAIMSTIKAIVDQFPNEERERINAGAQAYLDGLKVSDDVKDKASKLVETTLTKIEPRSSLGKFNMEGFKRALHCTRQPTGP